MYIKKLSSVLVRRLENNMLEEIKDFAFNGSQIFNL